MQGKPDIAQLRKLLFGEDHVEQTITHAISSNPKRFADVLYPVMGPAIRKSIQQALNEALATFNQLLEQSLSLRSWRWRFDAWRTGQSYATVALMRTLVYQVEQVFLIHRESGLLLQHVLAENAISKEPEIVSGMLTAIQDFIKDSFVLEGDDTLDTLRLGGLSVLVEHGPYAITAMVVRGNAPGELRTLLVDTSEAIHQQYDHVFQAYNGNSADFAGTEPLLSLCLKTQQQVQKARPPWLAYALLAMLAGGLAWWAYQYHLQQRQLAAQEAQTELTQQQTLQALQSQLGQQQTQHAALQTTLQTLLDQQQQQAQQTDANTTTLTRLTQKIASATHTFATASVAIDPADPNVAALATTIKDLLQTAQQADKTPQIMIIGNTDNSGIEAINQQLATKRAESMRNALIHSGVPAFVLLAYASNQAGVAALQHSARSVSYRVALY